MRTKQLNRTYIFRYPDYGTPDNYPEYTAHSGQRVTVLRRLSDFECDRECQPMYEIMASDGWRGHANGSELKTKEEDKINS